MSDSKSVNAIECVKPPLILRPEMAELKYMKLCETLGIFQSSCFYSAELSLSLLGFCFLNFRSYTCAVFITYI